MNGRSHRSQSRKMKIAWIELILIVKKLSILIMVRRVLHGAAMREIPLKTKLKELLLIHRSIQRALNMTVKCEKKTQIIIIDKYWNEMTCRKFSIKRVSCQFMPKLKNDVFEISWTCSLNFIIFGRLQTRESENELSISVVLHPK